MSRRTIIIIAAGITILLLGGAAYWYFFKKAPSSTQGSVSVFPKGSSGFGRGVIGTGATPPPAAISFVPGSNQPLPRFFQLHKAPVAGVGFFETGKKTDLSISARYVERGLGNIFESQLATFVESRISNETRPKIAEALWGSGGKSVVVRFLDEKTDGFIKTRILNLGATQQVMSTATSTGSSQNTFVKTEEISLPDYISFMATAGDNSDRLFYLQDNSVSVSGVLVNFKNIGTTKIFNSSFTEWLPQFPNQNLVTLTTKPSENIPGHMFFVNPKTKSVTKILGNINGLTTLTNPDGKLVLYSETKDGAPSISVYNVLKKETYQLSIHTLPEKCVWSSKKTTIAYCAVPQSLPTGAYPDQWYQGVLSFSDDLWMIDTATQNVSRIMSPGDFGIAGVDMTNLAISSNDAYLVFIDKVSSTPWVYRLSEAYVPTPPVPTITTTQTKQTTTTNTSTPPPTTQGQIIPLPPAITPDMQKIK